MGEDFGAPHEILLQNHYDLPVFITNYPTKIKTILYATKSRE